MLPSKERLPTGSAKDERDTEILAQLYELVYPTVAIPEIGCLEGTTVEAKTFSVTNGMVNRSHEPNDI
jgi:hypothetical protein